MKRPALRRRRVDPGQSIAQLAARRMIYEARLSQIVGQACDAWLEKRGLRPPRQQEGKGQ